MDKSVAITALAIGAGYLFLKNKSQEQDAMASYSFGAGGGSLGAGSTYTLLENSGNVVNNVNAPSYNTSTVSTVLNYSPTSNTMGSDAGSSKKASNFDTIDIPAGSPAGLAIASAGEQQAQLKKTQAVTGASGLGAGYQFPAPTKSTVMNYTPADLGSTKKATSSSSTSSSGGGIIKSVVSAIGRLFGRK